MKIAELEEQCFLTWPGTDHPSLVIRRTAIACLLLRMFREHDELAAFARAWAHAEEGTDVAAWEVLQALHSRAYETLKGPNLS